MTDALAEIRLPSEEIRDDLPFFTKTLGMRLDMIYPADNPEIIVVSGHGVRLRIEKGAKEPPGTLRLRVDDPDAFAEGKRELTAPNGTKIEITEMNPPLVLPETQHAFVVRSSPTRRPGSSDGRACITATSFPTASAARSSRAISVSPMAGRCPTWCITTPSASS